MEAFSSIARVAADPSADLGVVRHTSPRVDAAPALLVLLAATVLAAYTPRGKPRHNRLCWSIQKRAEEQSCIQCLMARESKYTPLLKLTSRALEIDRHELTNRVKTSCYSRSADHAAYRCARTARARVRALRSAGFCGVSRRPTGRSSPWSRGCAAGPCPWTAWGL
jgi:hypothetical protein